MKYALALEGGGAKGAYQAGVINALTDHGYEFNAVVGTSIGALNGAMIAQKKTSKLYELWHSMYFSQLFDFDDESVDEIINKRFTLQLIRHTSKKIWESIKNKGIESDKMIEYIRENIDEDLLRSSDIEYGLMTYNLSQRKAEALFKNDIEKGMIADYVFASANFPLFERQKINDMTYIDGGIYDNLPINMLIDKGYRKIIAIKTGSKARVQKVNHSHNISIDYIAPTKKPARVLEFTKEIIEHAMIIGYYDGLRYIHNLMGERYYIADFSRKKFYRDLLSFSENSYKKICEIIDVKYSDDKFICIANIVKKYIKIFSLNKDSDTIIVFIDFLENLADYLNIERLAIYSIDQLIFLINENINNITTTVDEEDFFLRKNIFILIKSFINKKQKTPKSINILS